MPDARITVSLKIWRLYGQERGDAIEMDKNEEEKEVEELARVGEVWKRFREDGDFDEQRFSIQRSLRALHGQNF
jgi:hypothetical protein